MNRKYVTQMHTSNNESNICLRLSHTESSETFLEIRNLMLITFYLLTFYYALPKWIDNILPRCIHPPPPQDSTVVIYASGYHILVFALALWSNDDFTKMKRLVNTYSYCNLKLHTLANITYCNLKMKLHTLANLEMLSSTINYKVFKCFFLLHRDRGRECVQ